MQSTHTALLSFPQLPLAARRAHVFPSLQNKALLSIGQICNSNFTAVFHDGQVRLRNEYTTITGQRDPSTGLYYIDLPEPPPVDPQSLHPFACSAKKLGPKQIWSNTSTSVLSAEKCIPGPRPLKPDFCHLARNHI